MFAPRFVDCSLDPSASAQLVGNACAYAGRYALGTGFRRRASRLGAPNARSGFFEPDVPGSQASPGWLAYSAIRSFRLSKDQQVRPRRLAECAPTADFRRGSLKGGGFVYQFATRFAALVLLIAPGMLAPTAKYRNRDMLTDVITRAFEVRDHDMVCGSVIKQRAGPSGAQQGCEFNSALDNVVGTLAFGLVANEPGSGDPTLQLFVGGTAPGIGEKHFAFPSDCFSRAFSAGAFSSTRRFRTKVAKRCPRYWLTGGANWKSSIRAAWFLALPAGWLAVRSDSRSAASVAIVCGSCLLSLSLGSCGAQ